MQTKKGVPASPGIAIAKAIILDSQEYRIPRRSVDPALCQSEIDRLNKAFDGAISELTELEAQHHELGKREIHDLFSVHRHLLQDRSVRRRITDLIEAEKVTAEYAVATALEQIRQHFAQARDRYITERAGDIFDIEKRLLRHLIDIKESSLIGLDHEVIVVAKEEPSEDGQFQVYADAIRTLGGRPATIRTMDLGADTFEQADYILCESTYGDRIHPQNADIRQKLCDIVNETREAGGNVIIPSFAMERAQELLYYLSELLDEKCIPPMLMFLDSPMAVNVTKVFQAHPELYDDDMKQRLHEGSSPFHFPGLSLVQTRHQSKSINAIRGTAIVIAGSGMCTGGRIKHHLATNITRPESTILFIGYQAEGTLGRRIVEGDKEVRILGQVYPVEARIAQIQGFSAHADRDELVRWLSGVKTPPRHFFVVHGEVNASEHLAYHVKEKMGWETSVPKHGDKVVLT